MRQHGATEKEIKEAIMIAMTVGAHKIRLMAEKGIPSAKGIKGSLIEKTPENVSKYTSESTSSECHT